MAKDKIHLAMVDDHQIVIDGIRSLLKGNPAVELKIETTSPRALIELLHTEPIDILLTDVMMPEMNGQRLAKEVAIQFPEIKIVALTMDNSGAIVNEMINEANIKGYILKNIGQQELLYAINKIAEGGIYFSESILEEMMKDSEIEKHNKEVHLTNREIEIIRLIEKEYSNKDIANELFLSERTVETHRKNIFRKTQTSSLIGLIKYAYEHKII